MAGRGPLRATDKRRNAGHKRPKMLGTEEDQDTSNVGHGKHLAHLFTDRRKNTNSQGKRAF